MSQLRTDELEARIAEERREAEQHAEQAENIECGNPTENPLAKSRKVLHENLARYHSEKCREHEAKLDQKTANN